MQEGAWIARSRTGKQALFLLMRPPTLAMLTLWAGSHPGGSGYLSFAECLAVHWSLFIRMPVAPATPAHCATTNNFSIHLPMCVEGGEEGEGRMGLVENYCFKGNLLNF